MQMTLLKISWIISSDHNVHSICAFIGLISTTLSANYS